MQNIGDLDHVIVLVRDLDRAEEQMTRLGFRLTPRGVHSAVMGTANSTFLFPDGTYVELLAVVNETPLNAPFVAELKEREGPFGLAMKTADAKAAAAEFAAAGVASGGPVEFARPVAFPEGAREAAFTIARIEPKASPGAWMFVCQHHTPDVVWRKDHLEQPNGAIGLAEVIGIAADLGPVEAAYRALFGARVQRQEDTLTVAAGAVTLRFLGPLAFAERFGRVARRPRPHLKALVLRSRDLDHTRRVLEANGLRCALSDEGTLIVPPDLASGAVLEFVRAAAG